MKTWLIIVLLALGSFCCPAFGFSFHTPDNEQDLYDYSLQTSQEQQDKNGEWIALSSSLESCPLPAALGNKHKSEQGNQNSKKFQKITHNIEKSLVHFIVHASEVQTCLKTAFYWHYIESNPLFLRYRQLRN